MPATLGLLSTQQESFEHHEELSKLLKETDVFYVPFQTDFHHNNSQDIADLTKRFDEDILNKHLVVVSAAHLHEAPSGTLFACCRPFGTSATLCFSTRCKASPISMIIPK